MDAGTKVEILEQGKWVGPFTVTAQAGRTPDHLVLSGPNGMFELYADAPLNVRPITPEDDFKCDKCGQGFRSFYNVSQHIKGCKAPEECGDTTTMDGVLGASIQCRRTAGHPGQHIGSGVKWGGNQA